MKGPRMCAGRPESFARPTRWPALGSGAGALAIAAVMILASSALASPTHATAVAPYKGGVQLYTSSNSNGCGSLKSGLPWSFNLTSGIGGSISSGKAIACTNPLPGQTPYSYFQTSAYVSVGVLVKVPFGATHIQANVSANWYQGLKATDGGKPKCTTGSSYDDTSLYAQWNYKKTSSGSYYANYNDSYWDRYTTSSSGTTWRNFTSVGAGAASVPSPWNFNGTTYWDWYHQYGGYNDCYSAASMSLSAYSYLDDLTNGSYIYQTGRTLGYYGQIFSIGVQVYNYSSWSCYNSTYWNGPSASWGNTTLTCYSTNNNATLISSIGSGLPPYWSVGGHNNSVAVGNASTVAGSWFWNYTFVHLHKYVMYFYLNWYGYASDSWPGKALGSFLLNMATLGYGFKLGSIIYS